MVHALSRRETLIAMAAVTGSTPGTPFAWLPIPAGEAGVAADLGDRIDAAQRNGELPGLHGSCWRGAEEWRLMASACSARLGIPRGTSAWWSNGTAAERSSPPNAPSGGMNSGAAGHRRATYMTRPRWPPRKTLSSGSEPSRPPSST